MSGMNRDELLQVVRTVWEQRDPVPEGLVARMQEAAALADLAAGTGSSDLDLQLMLLVERSEELAGTRGTSAAYTLRFSHDGTDLLLRVAADRDGSRIDGWVVPPEPMTVRALGPDGSGRSDAVVVGDTGRFELTDVPLGLTRLRLEPHDVDRPAFVTPTFEI